MTINYGFIPGSLVTTDLLEECAELYSANYGIWSATSQISPGKPIRLSPNRIKSWLGSNESAIYMAKSEGRLIGYAIAITVKVPDYGFVSWVTQLVVHELFRKKDVAKTLLFSIWGLSNHFAWGIVSANPYAVRALEKATRRRCVPARIARNHRKLLSLGAQHVPYIDPTPEATIDKTEAKINTKFFVDHSLVDAMIQSVDTIEAPWVMGRLDEAGNGLHSPFMTKSRSAYLLAKSKRWLACPIM